MVLFIQVSKMLTLQIISPRNHFLKPVYLFLFFFFAVKAQLNLG